MMLTWEKTGRTVGPEGSTVTWDHTTFVVLVDGCEIRREEYSLKYAKDFAEKITLEEDLRP